MTIDDLLKRVHIRYEKNTDYPTVGSEDHTVRMAFANDGINTWEKEAREGVEWDELKEAASISATGTGTDPLPTDFLAFLRGGNEASIISIGSAEYHEVSASDGNYLEQIGNTGAYAFWEEAGNLRTLPAVSGTVTFPYLRKATTYTTGSEITPIDMKDPVFLQEYILSQLYLDDGNINLYNSHVNASADILGSMRGKSLLKSIPDKFAIGQ